MRKKRLFKQFGLVVLFFLLYIAAGAFLPFIHMKKTGPEFQSQFSPDLFYGEGYSPDRAKVVEASMDALYQRIQMIHQARERIILSTFDIRDGESCKDLFSSVLEAADRGVKVQILVDGLYGSLHMNGNPIFYVAGSHPNIEIRFYNIPAPLKPWTINGRMHDKYLLIDNSLLLMGGRNTFDYFLGEYNQENLSYDRDVLIVNTASPDMTDSVISQVDDYFKKVWDSKYCSTVFDSPARAGGASFEAAEKALRSHYKTMAADYEMYTKADKEYLEDTVPIHKATLISNPIHIFGKEPWVWYQLQHLMADADERVYIHTPYAALSKDMYDGVAEIAAKVPAVAMMVNSTAVGDNFMASSDYTLNRPKILETGISLYEYFGDRSSHGKSMLIDHDLSVVGSYNLDMRSTYVNTETTLVIHGEEFNKQLEGHILAMERQSLPVNQDGSYGQKEGVTAVYPPLPKKVIFAVTSRLFQLIRYLI